MVKGLAAPDVAWHRTDPSNLETTNSPLDEPRGYPTDRERAARREAGEPSAEDLGTEELQRFDART